MPTPHLMKPYLLWLAALAAFSLALRNVFPIKPFDVLAVILGIAILTDRGTRILARTFWHEVRRYVKYFAWFLLLVCIAQGVSWIRDDLNPWNIALLSQYARLVFNLYTFLLVAFLMYADKRIVTFASRAIFLSPILVLPAHFAEWQASYIEGIRLAGLLGNPIIFGFWMMVAFFIGLGLYLDAKRPGTRFGIAAWLVIIANFILWSASRCAWIAIPFGLVALLYLCVLQKRSAEDVLHILGLVFISFALGQALLVTARIPISAKPQGAPDETYAIKKFVVKRAFNLVLNPTQNESRITIWREAISKNIQNPWGFGMYGEVSPPQFPGAANSYLEAPEAGGWGALAIFLLILTQIGTTVKQAIHKRVSKLTGLEMIWFSIGAALVINIFFYNFFFTRVLWFVLGAILGIALYEKNRAGDAAKT